jgi:hypothetical protein
MFKPGPLEREKSHLRWFSGRREEPKTGSFLIHAMESWQVNLNKIVYSL